MNRAASRRLAEEHAAAVRPGQVFAFPAPRGGERLGTSNRNTGLLADRVVDRLLSRRRRIDVLEGVLTTEFRSAYPLTRRRTNLTNVMFAKYEELSEVGPLFFEGPEGAVELYETYVWFRAVSEQVVQRHTLAEWLLLERRVLFGLDGRTSLAPRFFVESVLRRSRVRTPSRSLGRLDGRKMYASPRILEDVHDLLMITSAMWHVGAAYRTLCKGLVVTLGHPITYVSIAYATDVQVSHAVRLFDERVAQGRGRLRPRAGVGGPRFASRKEMQSPGASIFGWVHHDEGRDQHHYFLRWRTRYYPETFSTSDVFAPAGAMPVPPSIRSSAAAAALWACWLRVQHRQGPFRLRVPRGPWNLWGLCQVTEGELREALARWEPVAQRFDPSWSPEAGWDALTGRGDRDEWRDTEPTLVTPLRSGVLIVDLAAATEALFDAYERPAGGSETQKWTDLFEDQVQTTIDASQWSPPEMIRRLRKRTIRRENRTAITDLDAVGYRNGTLLLVTSPG